MANGQQALSPLEQAYQQAGGQIAPAAPAPQPGQELSPLEQAYQQAPDVPPTPSFGQQALQQGQDFFTQAEKGVLQSVQSVGELINKIPRIGQTLMPTAAVQAGRQVIGQMPAATSFGGKAGAAAEDIAEFVAGDEALKGLAIGDKLLQAGKVADYYEKASPFTKQALEHSMNMMRMGTAGAAVGGVKGGARGAEAGAVMGAAGEPLGEAAGATLRGAGKVLGKFRIPEVPPEVVSKVQPNLQANVVKMADQVAQEADVQPAKGKLRQTYEKLSDAIEAKAKDLFKQVDDATEGEFFNKRQEIDRLDREMKRVAGTETTEAEMNATSEMFAKKISLDQEMADLIQESGLDPKVADAAEANWRQKSALDDLDAAHKGAMPGHLQARGPQMDVNSWADRLERMRDSGRLQQALSQEPTQGGQRADQMLNDAYQSIVDEEGVKAQQTAREQAIKNIEARRAGRSKLLKRAAIGAAGAVGAGGLTRLGWDIAGALEKPTE